MKRIQMPRRRSSGNTAPNPFAAPAEREDLVDLERRRDQLRARVAELQWDLGGLVYEMAIRDHIKVDVLVRRAAVLQEADAELGEVERILRMEQTGAAGECPNCGAPQLLHVPAVELCSSARIRSTSASSASAS